MDNEALKLEICYYFILCYFYCFYRININQEIIKNIKGNWK